MIAPHGIAPRGFGIIVPFPKPPRETRQPRTPVGFPAYRLTAGAFRPWLADRGSLTQRVKDRCTAFRVEPLCQQFARVSLDETALIGLGRFELALTREVLLYLRRDAGSVRP